MKTLSGFLALLLSCLPAARAAETDEGLVFVPVSKVPKEAPLFFSASAVVTARAGADAVTGSQRIAFRVHQGKPHVLSLGLSGEGEILSVTGDRLRDWALRVADDGSRFLDVRPLAAEGIEDGDFEIEVKSRLRPSGGDVSLLLPAPGAAAGFSLEVSLMPEAGVGLRIRKADGLSPVAMKGGHRFIGTSRAELGFSILPDGPGLHGLEIVDAVLDGRLSADGGSVSFRLSGMAKARERGARARLIVGGAALTGGVSGDGWHVALKREGDAFHHELVAGRAGDFPVEIAFDVPVIRRGDWRVLDFKLPVGVVVPVRMEGLGSGLAFDRALAVVPEADGGMWRGFLPADGALEMAWKEADAAEDGAMFFSSTATNDLRVGSGLLRQSCLLDVRVLQGRLDALELEMEGDGELLSVTGEGVTGWTVREADGKRRVELKLSRPVEGAARFGIEAQAALGGFPTELEPLRFSPVGSLRHSGHLRVSGEGAVRVGVSESSGLIQLAPGLFPGGQLEDARQVFAYRFPSAGYGCKVRVDRILPEVSVSEITVYELTATDRRITSDIELDIREAALREWEMEIPGDHAVASVSGAEVADYVLSNEVSDGMRRLKVVFREAVSGRRLVHVKLEKSDAVKPGAWRLQPLGFPGAKSRRGHVGAMAAAGYRLTAGELGGMTEAAVSFFPKSVPGLQQAFRLRDESWSAELSVEELGRSVQADVFHLYSLKSGAVYGSVLINWFVVGAPASEWRVLVPEELGNVDVTGQNVGRDWRREGDTLVVPLSRPVSGAATLLVSFERPMSAGGGPVSPGEVTPLDVQAERGYVQVVSPLLVNYDVSSSEGSLLAVDASELPAEFRLLNNSPSLAVWQYTARDFKIGMDIEWFEPGETAGQVVEFLDLSSKVSRDGQWVTDVWMSVKTRHGNALRMTLPEGAALWEARVAGEVVNARADGAGLLVPLPPGKDPNQVMEVVLRYGARAEKATRLTLAAPVLDAPVAYGAWRVSGDEGRRLVPEGGSAELVGRVLAESGWEWLAGRGWALAALLALGISSLWLAAGNARGWLYGAGVFCGLLFVGVALCLGFEAWKHGGAASDVLDYAAPVVAPGGQVMVEIGNVAPWRAVAGPFVWMGLLAGAGLVAAGLAGKGRVWVAAGLAVIAAMLLAVRGGAPVFFLVAALMVGARFLPRLVALFHRGARGTAAMALLLMCAGLAVEPLKAEPEMGAAAMESLVQECSMSDGRLSGSIELAVRGEPGDRFLLLRSPAVLSGFEGDGMRVVKGRADEGDAYWIEVERGGRLVGTAAYDMPLPEPAKEWTMPTGPAAMQRITLRWDEAGWEFTSPGAVRVTRISAEGGSAARILPGAGGVVRIRTRPERRDTAAEETWFFTEVSNVFLPGPGAVDGRHRVVVRPAQGRVAELVMTVPGGFTVSDVTGDAAGAWRFDPVKRELRVAVEPAREEAFEMVVETQRGAEAMPLDLALEPMRVMGAAGEVGFFALAFGGEAQAGRVETEGMSLLGTDDFGNDLLPRDGEGRVLASLHQVYRYGVPAASARVRVLAVEPELRAEHWQWVSLGDDRILLTTDLAVEVTRAGVFSVEVDVPPGLEIETVTGGSLSHWTESPVEDGGRRIALHLAGKAAGRMEFNIVLGGPAVESAASWSVPKLTVRGASRETGGLSVVPGRGLQVRAVDRKNVTQVDPREWAGSEREATRAASRPGALAYRILQSDWSLSLAVDRLDPWVTAKVFHETTLREGQMLSRVLLGCRVENAAVKSLRVRLPDLDAAAVATVRANGPAVADFVPVAGEDGMWEIVFQRGIAGETSVEIEWQELMEEGRPAMIRPLAADELRQMSYFAAVRTGGRLELDAPDAPRGWRRTDWSVVRAELGSAAGDVPPVMAFRVTGPGEPLAVRVKRHALADLKRLRVSSGTLTSLVAPGGGALTAVELEMEVRVKSTLRLTLPAGSGLFQVRVNDEGVPLVREGGDWLFHVIPSPETGKPADVRFVYSSDGAGKDRLEGPLLNVPMENLTWRVLVPEGWRLASHGGDFDLQRTMKAGPFRVGDYRAFIEGKRTLDLKSAAANLDEANDLLRKGDQERASWYLSNAVRSNLLDDASDEDARVQLRQLRTQQAVLGLNTRRQRLVLDNRQDAAGAEGQSVMERAAGANPVLRGSSNYDPLEFDRLLAGNSADEIAALKEIANRIVSQQLATEPAPVALDVALPARGTVVDFHRSVQVDGARPMAVELKFRRAGGGFAWLAVPLCLLLGWMAVGRESGGLRPGDR